MRLRVLHLNSPLTLAGAEKVLLTYIDRHDRGRIELIVASYVNQSRMDNHFTAEMEGRPALFRRIPIANGRFYSPVRDTVRIIRDYRVNLVHSHGYRADITGLVAATCTATPIVSTIHGWTPYTAKLRFYESLDRLSLRFFDGIFCVSGEQRKSLISKGFRGDRLVHLPNAVALPTIEDGSRLRGRLSIGLKKKDIVILAVGRLSKEKGIDILLEAFRRHLLLHSQVKLVVVGDGPLREELETKLSTSGMGQRILFVGHRQDVASFYALADIFVLPSLTEGSPMVLLEAMSFGLPVLSSRVGGVPEIVMEGENGLLVPPGDPDALGKILALMATRLDYGRLLGERGRRTVERHFSPDVWARKLEAAYASFCTSHQGVLGKERL